MNQSRKFWKSAPLVSLLSALCLALLLSACAEPESSVQKCTVTSDCESVGYVCHQGTCKLESAPRECVTKADCISGEECISNFCGAADIVEDAIVDTSTTNPTNDVTSDTHVNDTAVDVEDLIPPTITAHTPAVDAVNVALNSTVTVTFSEPVIAASIVDSNNFFAMDTSGRKVPSTIVWDEPSRTATMTFTSPLWAWSTYEVRVSSSVMDIAQNSLIEVRWSFSTAAPAVAAYHDELARAYAPVIYQDVADAKRDTPTRIDFDNNLQPFNNKANVAQVSTAAVYYSVTETESHMFIDYILYYPTYKASSGAADQAHAVNGILVVVAKNTDRLGTLQFFSTYSVGTTPGRIDTFFPSCATGAVEPFCPLGFSGKSTTLSRFEDVDSTLYTDPNDARRVRVYVKQYDHEVCAFEYAGTSLYCQHTPGQFTMTDHAVLTLHTAAGQPSTPTYAAPTHAGSYALIPLATPWWTSRTSVGSAVTDFYGSDIVYVAPGVTQPGGGGGLRVPNLLATDDVASNFGLNSPWTWQSVDGFDLGKGVFFVDPAYSIQTMTNTPNGFLTPAVEYCFNLYTGIDRTQTDAPCQHN